MAGGLTICDGPSRTRSGDVTARVLPWTVEEMDACFILKDHTGHSLAYVYFEDEPGQ